MTKQSLPSDVVRLVSLYLEDLGTPRSLSVAIRLRENDWDGISEVTLDPREYLDASDYAKDAAAFGILKKLQQLPTTHDRQRAAIAKWWEGERACYKSNERLAPLLSHWNRNYPVAADDEYEPALRNFFREVGKLVESWIGSRPPQYEDTEGRFGPGATYSDRGGRTTVPDKINSVPSLTRGSLWYLPNWLETQWGHSVAQHHGELSFVRGNRFTTVPKTAKTDRSIAVEPSLNIFYQLGLGRTLRRRLRRTTGWDLLSAQEIHRQVAKESSVSREYCTLDLSNASDTVSRNLVKLLLPHHWFTRLDELRSSLTLIEGRWVMLEKFSSMGNGFTFELETILFAALACVVSRQHGYKGLLGSDVFVYGDDIIVKNDVARALESVLRFCGFELNEEKSFFDDCPFRESCGGDYFLGEDVRPYFLKELPNGPQDYFPVANGIRRVSSNLTRMGEKGVRRAWFATLDCIPTRVRSCRGPQVLGDVVIHDDEERWTKRWRRGIRYLQVYRPHRVRVIRYERFNPEVILACATYGCGNRRGGVIPRDGVLSFKVGWTPYS